ncbi:adenosylmethionine--8-amino-7-oxononanoate transaminase [Desulfotruncus alcoholivorax]|uniref:adenosylmethionine--8-amino-7-oxononanoate transaminase n=1 Tax=Desulfotruncus alcoholivorax TaxID=265477 RepID=UPI000423E1D9|nr:adenosylmethionine--8-amino-7-oxononanoate transaminase [Desulfotruncus alcoholivorax]
MSYYKPEQLEQWDKQYVWHPFTQMRQWQKEKPLIIEKGEGSYLYDIENNKYLDGISSLWVTVHGHQKKEINRAITEQLDKLAHSTLLGQANVPSTLLARKLVEITPEGLNKVFYSDSGSTAVEIGLKIAYQYWQQKGEAKYKTKRKFVSLTNAYHGDTIGSVSVGGIDLFHKIFAALLFETVNAPSPYCYRCPLHLNRETCAMGCVKEMESLLACHHHEIAGVVIEPLVQGAAGMLVAPEGYLARVRELCTRFNVLLIADEVAVGFGRTGKIFACDHENVKPDIMCLAKGITGGYLPLAATMVTDEIYNAFLGEIDERKTFYHGHTYTGNPLACAAALANLELFEKDQLIAGLQEKIAFLSAGLKRFIELQHVGEVRQKGLMAGIEIVENKDTKEPFPVKYNIPHRIVLEARKNGLIIRPLDNVIVLMPILSMSLSELKRLLDITYTAIRKVTEEESFGESIK